ncbi:hypothetical protein [Luteolibacter marinus]|uniref:hypothetical protein n=1 Tax=Luteolibacter marinus TaxID=2776705 RepID=UPI001867740A|nr:hypothetical protein [Luteolibacter marinus]
MSTWVPSSRDRFTSADFLFLSSVLAPGGEKQHLWTLWEDPEALREMLDLKEVLRALIDSPSALGVSPSFYFYVLVRHSFLESGIPDPGLADYVAGVMTQRLASNTGDPLRSLPAGLTHAADFVAILDSAQGRLRFHLQLEAANQFLVLTGMFPGFLIRRCQRRGAPGVEFYEDFARRAFRDAADSRSAPHDAPRRLFGELSEMLPVARRSLNKMAEEFVFLGD